MRARMALWSSGLTVELREIELSAKPQELLVVSPKGTVPVLVLPEGKVIEESLDIMFYALKHNDPDGWLTENIDLSKFWIKRCDSEFKQNLDRYKYPERFTESKSARPRGEAFLQDLENFLINAAGPFLMAGHETLIDVALFPFVRQWAKVDPPRFAELNLPRLKTWLNYHQASPLFDSIMKKEEIWNLGQKPAFFGRLSPQI